MNIKISMLILGAALVASCGDNANNGKAELEKYKAKIKSQSVQKLAPLPEFKTSAKVAYNAANFRSPFQPNVSKRPDDNRVKEALEMFPLDTLRMVGVLFHDDKAWALVSNATGHVFQVTVGDHMGQNSGRITQITQNKIELIELMSDGSNWREHPTSLALWQASKEKK